MVSNSVNKCFQTFAICKRILVHHYIARKAKAFQVRASEGVFAYNARGAWKIYIFHSGAGKGAVPYNRHSLVKYNTGKIFAILKSIRVYGIALSGYLYLPKGAAPPESI